MGVLSYKTKERIRHIDRYFFGEVDECDLEFLEAKYLIMNVNPVNIIDAKAEFDRQYGVNDVDDFVIIIFDEFKNIIRVTKGWYDVAKQYSKIYPNGKFLVYGTANRNALALCSELNVYFNPRDLKGVTLSFHGNKYKSINVIKNIYKNLFDGNEIETICEQYGVSIHRLNGNITVINKVSFNEAISQYSRIDFVNPSEKVIKLLI